MLFPSHHDTVFHHPRHDIAFYFVVVQACTECTTFARGPQSHPDTQAKRLSCCNRTPDCQPLHAWSLVAAHVHERNLFRALVRLKALVSTLRFLANRNVVFE